MASVSVYNMEGKETGKMELNDSIFAGCLLYTSPSPRDTR